MIETVRWTIRLRARDVMSSPVITVRADTSVKDVAATMLAHHISGLPVVSGEGELMGIVTEADLLHREAEPRAGARHGAGLLSIFTGDGARKAAGLTAKDLMTADVITVDEETPLHEVARLMVRRKIKRVPILRDGRVVGIVSRADVLRAFTRTDEEISRAVRDALLHELWIDISKVRLDVRESIVYLEGEVDRRSEKLLAERWLATIDGVIGVQSDLTFHFDDRAVRVPGL